MQNLPASSHLLDIDVRQDDVLKQLDELERRIQRVLEEYAPAGKGSSERTGLSIFRPSDEGASAQPEPAREATSDA